jgi:very-short-patch-repair endonuclease
LLNTNEVDKVITRWNREEGIDFNIDVEKYLILSKITPKVGVNTPSKTAPSEIGDSSGNKQRYPPSDMNTNPIEETIPEKKIDKNTSPIREITYIEPKQEHGCGKQHNSPSQRKKDTDLEQKFEEILKELGYNEGEDYIKQYGLLNYKIDFAFPELKIGFEPGASEWHATDKRWGDNYVGLSPESVYNEPKIEDVKKDRALYGSGWILIWLNEEFKHNIEDTKEYIQGILEKIKNDRESLKKEKEKCMQDIEELSEGPTVNPTTNPVDSKIEIKIESNGYTVKLIEKKDKYTYNHMILLDKENNEIRYD